MNNETQSPGTKLEMLSIELRRQHKYGSKSIRHVLLFTLILLVFFALYTALILYKIRAIATPTTIALLIAGELRDEASTQRSPLLSEDYRLLARETAHAMTSALPLLSGPVAAKKLYGFLSEKNLAGAEVCAEKLFTDRTYTQILDRLAHSPAGSILTEKEKDGYIEVLLGNDLSRETYASIHPLQRFTPGYAAQRLRSIRQKDSRTLGEKDIAFRDFVLCCLYFNENSRYRDSKYSVIFKLASPAMQELGFPLQGQNTAKNTPVRKEAPARK